MVIGVIVIVLIALASIFSLDSDGYEVTKSTITREPLPAGSVHETAYYTDTLDWISRSNTLEEGMKNFYKKTGIQPYLYIADSLNGNPTPTDADAEAFAHKLYDELFTDEAHLLVLFVENDMGYRIWYLTGSQAKTIFDAEAGDILIDYFDRYYSSDLTDEEYFSTVFDKTAERMMTVTKSPWVNVAFVALGVLLVIILFIWWNKAKEKKLKEAEETRRILETPIDNLAEDEAEKRAKKYE